MAFGTWLTQHPVESMPWKVNFLREREIPFFHEGSRVQIDPTLPAASHALQQIPFMITLFEQGHTHTSRERFLTRGCYILGYEVQKYLPWVYLQQRHLFATLAYMAL